MYVLERMMNMDQCFHYLIQLCMYHCIYAFIIEYEFEIYTHIDTHIYTY